MNRRNAPVSLNPFSIGQAATILVTFGLLGGIGGCEPAPPAELELVQGRMAVLPLANATEDAAFNELGLAFEEVAATASAGVAGADFVRVSQSGEIDAGAPLRTIAAETGAEMILRGTITSVGDEIELSAEIVDPTDETRKHPLPSERAPASDPSVAIDRLAQRVAGAIALHLDPEATAPWYYGVPTLESFRVAAHGDSLFAQNRQAESLPFLYEAHALDSMNFRPLFTAAAVHRNAGRAAVGDSILTHIEDRAHLLTELERYNLAWYRGNPEEALAAAKSAAAIDPKGWTYAVGLRANQAGRFAEAAEWLGRRQQLVDEGSFWAQTWPAFRGQYMTALHAIGDHETELAEAQLARSDFSDNPWWIWNEMMARAGMGQSNIVRAQYDTTVMLLETNENASHWENLEDIAVELMVHGQSEAGQALQEKVVEHYREVDNPFQLADALGFAGRPQEAYHVLGPLMTEATTPDQVGWYGAAAAIVGDQETAVEVLARLEAMPSAETGNNLRYRAAIEGALGNCDRAIEIFQQATEAGFTYNQAWGGEWWHRDWETQPVRENCSAFRTLMEKG